MYPYHFDKELIERTYQINFNYQLFYQNYSQFNPYLYPYNQSMLSLNFQNLNLPQNTTFYPFHSYLKFQPQQPQVDRPKKRKRIMKKLADIKNQNNFPSQIDIDMNNKQKSNVFKYFDPSRAPSITSLKSQSQLELDFKQMSYKADNHVNKYEGISNNNPKPNDLIKLQLLLKQPSENKYPFLICKKRKDYRIMKRRYSIFYFQQRANFIKNGLPIPHRFHPKNRSKKYNSKNNIDSYQPLNDISEQINDDQSVKSNSINKYSLQSIQNQLKYENNQCHEVQRQSFSEQNESSNDFKIKYEQ